MSLAGDECHGYIVGSRLPRSHPAYSPLLDFGYNRQTSAWRDDVSHHHSQVEEYYLVTQGSLVVEVGG